MTTIIHYPDNYDLDTQREVDWIKFGYKIYRHKMQKDHWLYDLSDRLVDKLTEYDIFTVVELSEDEIWCE